MANIFAGSEVVEMGIQIEKNGRDFYNVLVEKSASDKVKEVLKYLAEEEEKHIGAFETILSSVEKYEPVESYPGEYFAYLKALAQDHIFTKADKGAEIAKSTTNDREAVQKGIGFEKDSIVFYEGMKKVVLEHEQKIVDQLIAQEQTHLTKLIDLKSSL